MRDLLARQAKLNAALDLDKNETQIAPSVEATSSLRATRSKARHSLRESSGIPRRA